jgi:hypothetical protein
MGVRGSRRVFSEPENHEIGKLFPACSYVLAMCVRMLLLVNFAAVVAVMGKYLTEL